MDDRWRNRLSFGLGTLGRDMVGALISMYLMFYLTEILDLSGREIAAVTTILVVMRVFDALNDPVMGVLVDNTKTRWGKFKPWIAGGALLWGLTAIGMFVDTGASGVRFALIFTIVYLAYEIAYTINDISYYAMLPSLSQDQKEREKIGTFARIFANIGLFTVVVGVLPATKALGERLGDQQQGWLAFAAICVAVMLVFQSITVIFTRQKVIVESESTSLRELFGIIVKNDQLLWVVVSMLIFMAGYMTVTSLGIYYFKYIFGDEDQYPKFALVLGVSQLAGLASYPLVSRYLSRSTIQSLASAMCITGLVVFAAAGSNWPMITFGGILLFVGQAFIQMLLLMYVTDCVEYGHWKLGRRNESITVSLQPLVYKGSAALGSAFVGLAVIWSGITGLNDSTQLSSEGIIFFKIVMMGIPIILMGISWFLLHRNYRITESFFEQILLDISERESVK